MDSFDKFFNNNKSSEDSSDNITDVKIENDGNSISIGGISRITFQSSYVGTPTGSNLTDFYVYEWFIKETGEIFYVGKGRGDRYKEYHEHAFEAERIRTHFDTGVKFVAKNLTEEEALELETQEMTRILNETNDRLTNTIIPWFTKRDNGYSRSPSTPPFKFETAPVLYASEIDEHYFNVKYRPFDEVEHNSLSRPVFINKWISKEQIDIIYGGNYDKYYKEVVALLEQNGSKILKTKYAKSVTAWIYPCDDYVTNYELTEKDAEKRIGRPIPVYHLIDVWKYLKEQLGEVNIQKHIEFEINPVHNRAPLSKIKNLDNWEKGFDAGFKYWEKGDAERKKGNIDKAIQLFDKARYNGYSSPALYQSYAMAYRKLKDLDNEIEILDEAIERFKTEELYSPQAIITFEGQKKKAIQKLEKKRKNSK